MSMNHHVMWGLPRDAQVWRHAFGRPVESGEGATADASAWAPRVDIREEGERFVIRADVPGVDPAAIEVNMDRNVLSISGDRAAEAADASARFSRQERAHGPFHRRFVLPDSVDAEHITASNRHGVLEIVVPKKAESAPRRIVIDTAH
ncbi:Hsp20/alpha crystallin family protein [Rhodanobacter sp. PCA2]|uniref:Hsp20/alpha crystallin family protein n=1 Tax=Rhodanobacter sp. PCA2 TaxID=2006117 RepID=UPI0015E63E78|nr:Hsp20/alpha crystallin family protein [Rhodanobacter sp. PCA2]MBA2078744.1 heat-shock protein Hsp20 [Rhodanobacter sp. PCA2]